MLRRRRKVVRHHPGRARQNTSSTLLPYGDGSNLALCSISPPVHFETAVESSQHAYIHSSKGEGIEEDEAGDVESSQQACIRNSKGKHDDEKRSSPPEVTPLINNVADSTTVTPSGGAVEGTNGHHPQNPQHVQLRQGHDDDAGGNEEDEAGDIIEAAVLRDELRHLVHFATPIVATYLLENFPGVIGIVLVGHIPSDHTQDYLGAASLSSMFFSMTALCVGLGLNSAMDTLCSQAVGADEAHRLGTYLQSGALVLSAACVVVFFAGYHCEAVLVALGQPGTMSQQAGTFTWYLLPGVPFLYVYEMLRSVLLAQNVAWPMLCAAAASIVVNVVLGYYLVYRTSWGFLGAAVARTAGNAVYPVFVVAYLLVPPGGKRRRPRFESFWTGIHPRLAVGGIPEFLSLGVPGMLQVAFEWWAVEALALLCGLLPSDPVAAIGANAVILQLSSLTYMFYYGISESQNVRIGNALGAGLPERARLASALGIGASVAASVACAATFLVFRHSLLPLFTHDAAVVELASSLMTVAAVFQLADAVNAAVLGIFRGSGRQRLGATLNFVGYYVVGIPLGAVLAFVLGGGVVGLWAGLTVGLFAIAAGGMVLVLKSDWIHLAEVAQGRLNA